MLILTNRNITEADFPYIGGKARGLYQLQQLGFRVPPYVVIPWADIEPLLKEDPQPDEQGFAALKDTILPYFPTNAWLAVRSSAGQEDGAKHSFAGLYQTQLYVNAITLAASLQSVALSAQSERINTYRQQRGLDHDPAISIIVQQMVEAEVSGVAFGMNPVTGDKDVKIINAVYGLGEGLVSGQLTADTFEIRGGLVHSVLATKQVYLTHTEERGIVLLPVEPEKQTSATLNPSQIAEITQALDILASQLSFVPDVEFAYADGYLYLLQVRPVTTGAGITNSISPNGQTSVVEQTGVKTIWDNSNIVESYPGITLPLTYSFISKVYEAVYRQLSVVMGIDPSVIDEHRGVYANMLGHIYGRVYYNLNSWHTALSLLPGYGNNREFMDKMMGTKEKFDAEVLEDVARFHTPWRRAKSIIRMLQSLLTVEKGRRAFIAYFRLIYEQYNTIDYRQRTLSQLRDDYFRFENTLLKEWKAPLVNDLFCMMYFGWLQKLVAKHQPGPTDSAILNDLLGASSNVITVQPAIRMRAFTETIRNNPALYNLFTTQDAVAVWQHLAQQHPTFYQEMEVYLQQWGHRCMAELKLETISYAMQPALWIHQLQLLLQSPSVASGFDKAGEQKTSAEQTLHASLKGKPVQRRLFNYVLNKARYFVSNRENLRYERTKAFAVVRQLFLAMGEQLTTDKQLTHPRDIFYLTQNEVFDFIDQNGRGPDLHSIVADRKTRYTAYESVFVPERFTSQGDSLPTFGPGGKLVTAQPLRNLKGIAASAGVVQGMVQVVHHPHEVASLQGDILVTVSTDPGWVVLFPGCKGILVERGSLLSHAAIVSREMGIPCIVGIPALTQVLKTGDFIRMNGATGEITVS